MTPHHIGHYAIVSELGHGGMSVVYRARDETGKMVALKTVAVPHAEDVGGMRREIRALAGLRHPGVVRILDDGTEGGVPWYAMELIDGPSLEALAAGPAQRDGRSPTVRLAELEDGDAGASVPLTMDRGRALTITRRLCDPLAFIHGEGIVHRDLKPANVIVRRGDRPVIVDFGLVSRFMGATWRERFEREGLAVGTIDYMAPEQIDGELPDARADIYALGCILFGLLVGQPPFGARQHHDVLRMKLSQHAPPPSSLDPGIPAELDDLVARMLARDPSERLGYATDVAVALEAMGAAPARRPGRRARSYLYRPRFTGRDRELRLIEKRCAELHGGRGGIVMVTGASGAGKTRLLVGVAGWATNANLLVLSGAIRPPIGSGGAVETRPLAALLDPLRAVVDRCRELGAEESARIVGDRAAVLATVVPAVANLPDLAPTTAPPELPPREARLRLLRAVSGLMLEAAREQPTLLVLDDLQWADDMTLAWLEMLERTGALADRPLMIAGCYRGEEASDRLAGLGARLGEIGMGPLAHDAVRSMVADMLAVSPPPEALVEQVAAASDGNPFFVAEYLRVALIEGLLSRDTRGRWSVSGDLEPGSLSMPRSLRAIVGRRLRGLDPIARRLVRAASVLGRELEVGIVATVAACEGDAVLAPLSVLLRRNVLEESAPGVVRFCHDKLREVAYGQLRRAFRARLHGAAARALEERGATDRAGELARHWLEAGDRDRARPYFQQAAMDAMVRYAHSEAEAHARAYLELTDAPTPESTWLRVELAQRVLVTAGRLQEAVEQERAAVRDARRVGDRRLETRARVALAAGLVVLSRHEEARAQLAIAARGAEAAGDVSQLLAAQLGLAVVDHQDGSTEAAESGYRAVLAATPGERSIETEHRCIGNLAALLDRRGERHEAMELFERALAIGRELGDLRRQAFDLTNLAGLLLRTGRHAESDERMNEALRLSRIVGDRRLEGTILNNLAALAAQQGELARALGLLGEAHPIHREIGDLRGEGMAIGNLAGIHHLMGSLDEAHAEYQQALAIHREVENRWDEALMVGNLGELEGLRGNTEEALALLARSIELHEGSANRPETARSLANRADILRGMGRLGEARADLARALALDAATDADRQEAIHLVALAHVELEAGALDRARELLERGIAGLEKTESLLDLARAMCVRGHLLLARGLDASSCLAQARAVAAREGVRAASPLGQAIASLAAAIEARGSVG